MARSTLSWMRAAALAALATQTIAQKCYYPNGAEAPDTEKPCASAEGSACCPDTWECLDNGLCHLPANNLYGRYSCTDKSWGSPGCASNMCTYDGRAVGGESIKQCSNHNNDWCCNADDTNVKCCQESPAPRPFFQLQDGKAYATIGRNQASNAPNLASITGLASGSASGGGNSPSRTPAPSASNGGSAATSAPGAASSARPVTSEITSLSSGSAGIATIVQTLIVTPSSSPDVGAAGNNPSSSGGGGTNLGLIVGCAVGIPLALALLGIIIWMLRKRRHQKANDYKESPGMGGESPSSSGFSGGAGAKLSKNTYRHSRPGTSEIDGAPVGPGRPVSHLPGRAELDSGSGFQPGHGPAYTPDTVGLGGGNGDGRPTWGSAPPGYSPGANQTAFAQHAQQPTASELPDTSVMPVINEKPAGQQYQAYRPPQPAAELPTLKTPPEDIEKQLQR